MQEAFSVYVQKSNWFAAQRRAITILDVLGWSSRGYTYLRVCMPVGPPYSRVHGSIVSSRTPVMIAYVLWTSKSSLDILLTSCRDAIAAGGHCSFKRIYRRQTAHWTSFGLSYPIRGQHRPVVSTCVHDRLFGLSNRPSRAPSMRWSTLEQTYRGCEARSTPSNDDIRNILRGSCCLCCHIIQAQQYFDHFTR